MAATDDLDRVIEQYHQALDEFSRGNPDPVKEFYSTRDDVAIANPFFPLTRGREQVVERLERSVQNFSDGQVGFQNVAKWVSGELACIVELEEWKAKVGGREEVPEEPVQAVECPGALCNQILAPLGEQAQYFGRGLRIDRR